MSAARDSRPEELPSWAGVVLFAAACAGMSLLDHHPFAWPNVIPSVWPTTGVALAGLLLSPTRRWPLLLAIAAVIMLGRFVSQSGFGWSRGLLTAGISAAQVYAMAWLSTRSARPPVTLRRVRDVLVLLGAAVLGASLSTFLLAILVAPGLPGPTDVLPRARWISQVLGALVITPLIVTWAPALAALRAARWPRIVEAGLLLAATLALLPLAFAPAGVPAGIFPAPYLAILPIVAAAIRFGPPGAAAVTALVTVHVVTAVGRGESWPPGESVYERLAIAQLFLGVAATTGLLLAAHVAEKDRAIRRVTESETRFRTLFEHSLEPTCAVRGDQIVLANQEFVRLAGREHERDLATHTLPSLFSTSCREKLAAALATVNAQSRRAHAVRLQLRRADSAEIPVEARFSSFEFEREPAVLVSFHDLSEQEAAERESQRINRALRAITACSQVLVNGTSEGAVLHETCRVVTGIEGYRLAWIGYVEHNAQKTIRPVASAGFAAGSLERAHVTWADEPAGRGPCGRSVRTGKPAVCANASLDADDAPWREETAARDYRSSVALPLMAEGWVFGVLSLYSDHVADFGPEEVAVLQQMADSLASTLSSVRAREKQAATEAEVRRLLAEAEVARGALLSLLEDERLAQEQRVKSDERFQRAVHNSAIGMSLVTPDGRWIEVNPAFCQMIGYPQEELVGQPIDELHHPADRAAAVQRRADLLAGRIRPYAVEKRYLHKSGRIVWVQQNVSLVEADGTGAAQLFCQTQDITARKLAEESLAAVAERLALALRASKFGVWRYNLQLRISEWDTRMFAIFGFPPGAVVPTLDEILARVAEEDREAVRRSWTASPACEHAYQMRFRVIWPDGQVRHIDLQGIVHDDALGRPEWTIGVAGDITDIIQATSESERLRAQLQQARKMETLGTMAAGVAHDFNNLLTGINGFVELASTALPEGHEANQLLQRAKKGAISARDLVRRILNFSRSSTDQTRTIVDVLAVVRDTAPLIVAAMPANVSVSIAPRCEDAPVLADVGQLQQVLLNFCTNGAHAIGRQPGRIEIGVGRCAPGEPGGPAIPPGGAAAEYVRLWVADTGSGMDEETRRRLFEPFFTTKKSGEGTGLGLSIVHDIVCAHGGAIDVASAPGQGSTFSVYLPVARLPAPGVVPESAPLPSTGAGQRILVVDDEASVGLIVRLALQKGGYTPEVYSSPNDAWKRFSADPRRFDLLIVDKNMPEITGPRFIAQARAVVPDLPVILVSGRFEQGKEEVEVHGERIFALKKPFELADLLTTVREAMELERKPVAVAGRAP